MSILEWAKSMGFKRFDPETIKIGNGNQNKLEFCEMIQEVIDTIDCTPEKGRFGTLLELENSKNV